MVSPDDLEAGVCADVHPPDYFLSQTGPWTDPLLHRKLSLSITLLEGGILFHSVFVGMALSLTIDGFVILLVAILFHQMFEGLGLGSRIAVVPYPKGSIRPWLLVCAFGFTAPLGQAIGLAARGTYDPNSAFGLIIVGVFNAMWVFFFLCMVLRSCLLLEYVGRDHGLTGGLDHPACSSTRPWWTSWRRTFYPKKPTRYCR